MDYQENKDKVEDDKPRLGGVSDLSVIEESEQLRANGDNYPPSPDQPQRSQEQLSNSHPARSLSPEKYAEIEGLGRRTRSLSAVQIQGNNTNNTMDEYPKMPRRSSLASGNRPRMQKHVSFSSSSDEKAIASGKSYHFTESFSLFELKVIEFESVGDTVLLRGRFLISILLCTIVYTLILMSSIYFYLVNLLFNDWREINLQSILLVAFVASVIFFNFLSWKLIDNLNMDYLRSILIDGLIIVTIKSSACSR